MNRTIKNLLLLSMLILVGATSLSAQKFGYTNSAAILVEMPETKSADEQLATFQKRQQDRYNEREATLNADIEAYITEAQGGSLTRLQMEEREADLQRRQQELQQFDMQLTQEFQQKREELYGPILNRVQTAIDEVGQEGGYTMIFDVSVLNLILFAEESDDVTSLIKAKL